jgi:hypothetical protein
MFFFDDFILAMKIGQTIEHALAKITFVVEKKLHRHD